MRRVIGIDIHRTFGEVVIWENGVLRHAGRVDMTRTGLEGFGKNLRATDEVVIEATGNCLAVSRVLSPFVKQDLIANPLQVKAIALAHVKTDKVNAGTLASLHAAGYLPEIWTPDAATERLRWLVARRYQVVRHRTRLKNEVHAIPHAHLIPKCPHSDLFNGRGRAWLSRQPVTSVVTGRKSGAEAWWVRWVRGHEPFHQAADPAAGRGGRRGRRGPGTFGPGLGERPRPEGRGGKIDGANPRDLGPAQALLRLAVDRRAGEKGFEADRAQGRLAAENVGRAVMRFEDTVSLRRIVSFNGSENVRGAALCRKRAGHSE